MIFRGVALCEGLLRLDNGDQRGYVVAGERAEEALRVSVNEADESDADGRLRWGRVG